MPCVLVAIPIFLRFFGDANRGLAVSRDINGRDISQVRRWNNVELHPAASAKCKQCDLTLPDVDQR